MSFLNRIIRLFQDHEEDEAERTSTELTFEKQRLVEFTREVNRHDGKGRVFVMREGDFLEDELFGPVKKRRS